VTIHIRLKWLIIILFLISEAVILYAFAVSPEARRTVIAFGGSIVGAAFALFVYMQGVEDQQSKAADKLFERWNHLMMAEYKNVGRDIRRGVLDPLKLARSNQNTIFSDPEKTQRASLLGLLSFYEEVSLAIRMRSANQEKPEEILPARDGSNVHQSECLH